MSYPSFEVCRHLAELGFDQRNAERLPRWRRVLGRGEFDDQWFLQCVEASYSDDYLCPGWLDVLQWFEDQGWEWGRTYERSNYEGSPQWWAHRYPSSALTWADGPEALMLAVSEQMRAGPVESKGEVTWQEEIVAIHQRIRKPYLVGSREDQRFVALALAGEVGEMLNLVKKEWRGDFHWRDLANPFEPYGTDNPTPFDKLEEELADIQIYLTLLSYSFGVDLETAVAKKMPEIRRRWPETDSDLVKDAQSQKRVGHV